MGRISQRSLKRAGKEFDLFYRTNDKINNKKEDMSGKKIFNVKIISFNKYIGYHSSFIGSITKAYRDENGIYVHCYFGGKSIQDINDGFRHVEENEVEIL